MAKSSPYDDPAILNRFLDVVRGNAQSAKSATQSEKPVSKLNPESQDFSSKVMAAGSESGLSKTSSRPNNLQSGCQQGATASLLAPSHSPFPHVSIAQRTAPVDLIQDQNGIVTEQTNPPTVQDRQSLMQEHPNTAAATDGPPFLTPTQHRLLVGKKPGVEHITENRLAELSHQTQGYMDSVVDRFRKSKERILGQNSIASGRVALAREKESNMDATDAATFHQNDETSIESRVSQGKRDEPGKTTNQLEGWQEKAPDSASCRTLFADSAYKTGGQQSENDSKLQV
ncbi:uncharacterized protein Z519_10943 [Cladophialophora bantiana CBS 173.52]|uniref:Uncharacterized protein n=1 Tax=Cladophialophora bantiana (strain ATCC 10958 / CBS 173.52 / CDC B-1940 / NIH 8579) TaxID=1442370 RepID=A0A0D2HV23_CLAB1|nr:uncharacterized protein Z519_10943 [Cladophialophora bantiana CBS 173.52]KIW88374.1 hypothetical protein Z519_10943 [Cladophialophora bantiana CBS 173.52]